jgi:hypothetical protein
MVCDGQGNYTFTQDEVLALWEATAFYLEHAEETDDLKEEQATIARIDASLTQDFSEDLTVEGIS